MSFWTLERVAAALREISTGAIPASDLALAGVSTDTRRIARGELFVALRGEQFDAHEFLAQAVASGAAALVVDDPSRAEGLGVPVVAVGDTTRALGLLGRYRRRAWGRPVVAVAGSNGKTSTKELLAAALGARLSVHATKGNLNNQIGVPLTLLALPDGADAAVVELGTNQPGEVALLRDLVEPQVAVVTSIGEEHLEGFGDLEGVLREESAVFAGVELAVCPAAQPEIADAARRLARRTIVAGLTEGDVRPDEWGLDEQGRGWLRFGEATGQLPVRGEHNVRNALLALAAAEACGIAREDALRGLERATAPAMRMAWHDLGALTVVNDAYNSNPASAREAIRLLDGLDTTRHRVLVLGTMLELGAQGRRLHEEIGALALGSRATLLAGIGEFASVLARLAPGDARVVTAPDVPELWPLLSARLAPDSVVLLKGSRGMRLERLLPLLADFAGADAPGAAH